MNTNDFLKQLKREFAESAQYGGYDADDNPGYFVEWLVEQLYIRRQPRVTTCTSCNGTGMIQDELCSSCQ